MNKCPSCETVLLPGSNKCRDCGWGAADHHAMPTIDTLKSEIKELGLRNDPEWYLKLLEKHKPEEAPRKVQARSDKSKSGGSLWQWPYRDRVLFCLRKFKSLPEVEQQTIISARKDKIYWRGDDLDFFMRVIEETEKMREMGIDKYKAQAMKQLNGITRNGKHAAN